MPPYKISLFHEVHPDSAFPWFRALDSAEIEAVEASLIDAIANPAIPNIQRLHWVMEGSRTYGLWSIDGTEDEIVSAAKDHLSRLAAAKVYVIDELMRHEGDEMLTADLVRYFENIWLADDLLVTSDSLTSMLWVFHYGRLAVASVAEIRQLTVNQ